MKLKRITAALLAGVMCVGLLAGCGSKGDGDEKGSGDKITIRLLTRMAGTTAQVDIYNDILDEFKEKHPEVTIVDDSQGDESAFNNILSTDIASGTMANIFRIQGVANLSEYIDNGLILDVQPYLDEDPEWGGGFTEGALSYYQVPEKEGTYAIPMESGLIGVYYNKDLFEKAGVKEFPETWTEFLDAIKKLGSRDMKWTDPEVVETLQFVQDLIDAGAFDKNAAGMTDNIAMTQFQQGEAAMVITGPWNIGTFEDPAETPVCDSIEVAKFPYFEEKPEFKNEDMQTLSPYMISGKLEGKELELTLELVKMLTDKDAAKRFAEEAAFLIPRTDIDLDESAISPLFAKNVELGGTSEGIGVDVFDFDPLASMQDRTRNSISSMFTGEKPDSVAKEIQSEIDK